mmetsp:Transcript_100189/g.278819  ORF Transcript_100189/g.278819 Transcript_100189/m.278819 type:complete len:103 (-) Transcript_100189:17-325(-)
MALAAAARAAGHADIAAELASAMGDEALGELFAEERSGEDGVTAEDDLDDIPTEESPGTHIDDDMLRHTMHFEGMPRHGGDGEDRDDGGLGGLFEATRRTSL